MSTNERAKRIKVLKTITNSKSTTAAEKIAAVRALEAIENSQAGRQAKHLGSMTRAQIQAELARLRVLTTSTA